MLKTILSKISVGLLNGLVVAINAVCDIVKKILEERQEVKLEKKKDAVKDALENGDLADLEDALNNLSKVQNKVKASMLITFLTLSSIFCGCATTNDISINTVHSWEKRYTSKDNVVVNNVKLDIGKDEKVWILTSKTLHNILTKASEVQGKFDTNKD